MNDVLLVNVCDCLNNLSHESRAGLLRQNELVLDDSIEKFAASNAEKIASHLQQRLLIVLFKF
jgi:hypothetical protein